MTLPRPCLECGVIQSHGTRCRPHDLLRQKTRNLARKAIYGGTWYAKSRAARRGQPWCSICFATTDLTLDHEHGQVECRSCNSSHRAEPA